MLTGTGPALGDAIATAIKTLSPDMTDDQFNQLKSAWELIATEVVNHIVANAQVNPGSFNVVTAPGPVIGLGDVT